ncbi:Protein of unknown function [Prosthecobacter debontii]|uniref:DUF2971 domain-containing protein n=1 Tax=Prosthecobacter debontii TaxID=48467 RepID=A0A1T4X843_9BACT|nr:DUF2971 domain-containing protein [Prosthecobacter debontii]SKA85773.1 Protein of unknown function [Prosthecobacter debontii]
MSTKNTTSRPPSNNFLNWDDQSKIDAPIYRFMPFARLREMATGKKNCLVRTKLWDDPFENFLFSATALDEHGNRIGFGMRDDLYGQCWTDAEETDAMWRIYSHEKDGVRVRCTPRKLLSGLYKSEGKFRDISCFIGKVSYHSEDAIRASITDPKFVNAAAFDTSGVNQCKTLLLKRLAFSHESEVRLIYLSPNKRSSAEDRFFYPLDPLLLFDEIVLDPRLEDSAVAAHRADLATLGFNCTVRQSDLYRIPNLVARLS